MPQFSGREDDLSAVVGFMSCHVDHEVGHIGGDIGPRDTDLQHSPLIETGLQQCNDAPIAAFQRAKEGFSSDAPSINTCWDLHSVLSANHFDPHTSSIMNVACDHADRPPRGAGNLPAP